VAGYAVAGANVAALAAVGFVGSFFLIGAQNILNATAGHIYPPRMRATGVGWGIGVGRVGGVIGPLIAGALVAAGWPARAIFIAAGLPIVVAAGAALALHLAVRRAASDGLRRPE
jgi:AAHS family 4-hydroxybenzoate transporter-like MFS transporter